jgi:hypothetical protein
MKSSSWLRNPNFGPATGRAEHTRHRKPPASRPQVEPLEGRRLLSLYNTPIDLGTLFPRAINNLGQEVGGIPYSGAFLRQSNGTVITVDPTGIADDLTDSADPA